MKQIFALLTALLLVLSFAACGTDTAPTTTDAPTTEPVQSTAAGNAASDVSPVQMLWADFQQKYTEDKSAEALANDVITNDAIPYMCGVLPVEEGLLSGFGNTEITGFSEGAQFAPMIGSIPFVGYIFKVDGDVNAFMDTLRANADLRWNICTEADEMLCEAVGNTVFFLMAPASFAN